MPVAPTPQGPNSVMSGHRLTKLSVMQRAQALIDSQLVVARWEVQDKIDVNLFAAEGVAVREAVMSAVFEPESKRFFPPRALKSGLRGQWS